MAVRKIVTCDRCGREMDTLGVVISTDTPQLSISSTTFCNTGAFTRVDLDLCPQCYDQLVAFMAERPSNA